MQMLVATSKLQDEKRARARDCAIRCLRIAEQHNFIRPTAREEVCFEYRFEHSYTVESYLQHERRTHTTTVDPNAIIVSSINEEEEDEDEQ